MMIFPFPLVTAEKSGSTSCALVKELTSNNNTASFRMPVYRFVFNGFSVANIIVLT
jgi:hypothetical protein